uniref:RPW8 domain-containing protein n=1 Tax=Picea sitchensis TaxID=3332 RepID=D5A825_PICSI|nr:unknown [Picea sitchensis]
MAASLVIQSLAGAVTGELLGIIKDVLKKSFACKENCKRLQKTLEGIMPVLADDTKSSVELSQPSQSMLSELHQELQKGVELVKNCSKVSRLNVYKSYKYANEIKRLESYIVNFTQTKGWVHICSELRSLSEQQHKMEDKLEKIELKIDAIREESEIKFIADQMDQLDIGKRAFESNVPE